MNEEIIVNAINHFGADNQISKAMEEMSELTTELARYQTNRGMNVKIIEEIADVIIMMEQLKKIFDEDMVNSHIAIKLRRLELMIDGT